ncbi:TPA: hypothetical protein ACIYHL_003333 [Escherichia coli]
MPIRDRIEWNTHFSEYPSQAGALDTGCAHGVAALMEYLLADLTDIAHSCALIEGGAR